VWRLAAKTRLWFIGPAGEWDGDDLRPDVHTRTAWRVSPWSTVIRAGDQCCTPPAHASARPASRRPPDLEAAGAQRGLFPYFSLDLRFDDRYARELLDPLGIRATPIIEYFDALIDFAEAARWGRDPIGRARARARIEQFPGSVRRPALAQRAA
jgi:hypothetical protein